MAFFAEAREYKKKADEQKEQYNAKLESFLDEYYGPVGSITPEMLESRNKFKDEWAAEYWLDGKTNPKEQYEALTYGEKRLDVRISENRKEWSNRIEVKFDKEFEEHYKIKHNLKELTPEQQQNMLKERTQFMEVHGGSNQWGKDASGNIDPANFERDKMAGIEKARKTITRENKDWKQIHEVKHNREEAETVAVERYRLAHGYSPEEMTEARVSVAKNEAYDESKVKKKELLNNPEFREKTLKHYREEIAKANPDISPEQLEIRTKIVTDKYIEDFASTQGWRNAKISAEYDIKYFKEDQQKFDESVDKAYALLPDDGKKPSKTDFKKEFLDKVQHEIDQDKREGVALLEKRRDALDKVTSDEIEPLIERLEKKKVEREADQPRVNAAQNLANLVSDSTVQITDDKGKKEVFVGVNTEPDLDGKSKIIERAKQNGITLTDDDLVRKVITIKDKDGKDVYAYSFALTDEAVERTKPQVKAAMPTRGPSPDAPKAELDALKEAREKYHAAVDKAYALLPDDGKKPSKEEFAKEFSNKLQHEVDNDSAELSGTMKSVRALNHVRITTLDPLIKDLEEKKAAPAPVAERPAVAPEPAAPAPAPAPVPERPVAAPAPAPGTVPERPAAVPAFTPGTVPERPAAATVPSLGTVSERPAAVSPTERFMEAVRSDRAADAGKALAELAKQQMTNAQKSGNGNAMTQANINAAAAKTLQGENGQKALDKILDTPLGKGKTVRDLLESSNPRTQELAAAYICNKCGHEHGLAERNLGAMKLAAQMEAQLGGAVAGLGGLAGAVRGGAQADTPEAVAASGRGGRSASTGVGF